MFTTQHQTKLTQLAAIGFFALFTTQQAFAVGTASGIDITNFATIDYEVDGVNQTDIDSNTITFKVDAKVDFTVTGTDNTSVTPDNLEVLEFTVANDGNEVFAYNLASEAGAETFTVAPTIHVDTNGNGTWDGVGIDLPGTSTGDIPVDTAVTVWLVGTIPASATDNQTSTYHLMATALLAGGGALPVQAPDVATTKQYVYADGQGPHSLDSASRDAKHSAAATFTVQTASLTITKTSSVVWDPINLASSPLHIPGAIIEYKITIANGGSTTATAIIVTDILNANLTVPATPPQAPFTALSSIQVTSPNLYGGVATNLTDVAADDEGTITGQTVTVTDIVLTGGQSATVKIQAVIN